MKNCPYDGVDGDPLHQLNVGYCNEDEPWKCPHWNPAKFFCPHLKEARIKQKQKQRGGR